MSDEEKMRVALNEAEYACSIGEVPVGAAVFSDDTLLSSAHNRCRSENDPSLHAEFLAMRDAYKKHGSLERCTLYVTLEPCAMCAGAMIRFRLPRLVYGAFDPQAGCCGSRIDLSDHWFEHSVETIGGVLETECEALLRAFFESVRTK